MIRIAVTGSSGFVGQQFLNSYKDVYQLVPLKVRLASIDEVNLSDVDVIIHLAGKAHQMTEINKQIYFDVNYLLTKKLVQKAKESNVKHFIFISTVKVFGESDKEYYSEDSFCKPHNDPYAESKLEAEKFLSQVVSEDFIVSIIRPPLVYGAGAKGNLLTLMKLIKYLPILPFKGIHNKRSMVYVGNLNALIARVIDTRKAGLFIAGDQDSYSTTKLAKTISDSFKRRKLFITFPKFCVKIFAKVKPRLYSRFFNSLVFNNSKTNAKLAFEPPFTFEEGINEMVTSFIFSQKNK